MTYLLLILAGALLCNGIPHSVAGLQGVPFPTPFAKPRGVGRSPAIVNFAWGSANLLLGLILALWRLQFAAPFLGVLLLACGFVAVGIYLSMHFGKVQLMSSAGASSPGAAAAGPMSTHLHPRE